MKYNKILIILVFLFFYLNIETASGQGSDYDSAERLYIDTWYTFYLNDGERHYFYAHLTAGEWKVILDGPDGADFDVIIKDEYKDTIATGITSSADEEVTFYADYSGKYYIIVKSYEGSGYYSIKITYVASSPVPIPAPPPEYGDGGSPWDIIEEIRRRLEEFFNGILDFFNRISGAINNFINTITTGFQNLVDAIENVFEGIRNAITSIFEGVSNAVSNFINGVVNAISTVGQWLSNFIGGIVEGVKNTINVIVTTIQNVIAGIANAISAGFEGVIATISSIVQAIINGLRAIIDGIVNAIKSAIEGICNIFNIQLDLNTTLLAIAILLIFIGLFVNELAFWIGVILLLIYLIMNGQTLFGGR